jgi:hypothetical protein
VKRISAGRLWTATLLAGSVASAGASAPDRATDLERAFGAAFELVPAVAKHAGGASCQNHAQQAFKIAQLRDLRTTSSAQALALLTVPEISALPQADQSIAAALTIINRAVVDYVYGPNRPPPDIAAAIVNSACLIEVGKVIGGTKI